MKTARGEKWELTWDEKGRPQRGMYNHTFCSNGKHYHGAIYNDPEILDRRMDENIWFQINQTMLLWVANTKEGRDLLSIKQSLPKITYIAKNVISFKRDQGYTSEFRVGAKYANIIRFRWNEFKKLEEAYYNQFRLIPFAEPKVQSTLDRLAIAAGTVTAYPDADPETTTVDGETCRDVGGESFATIRTGAGTFARPTGNGNCGRFRGDPGGNYTNLCRGHFLFDTSSIPDTDGIDDATFSVYISSIGGSAGWGDTWGLGLVGTNPASNTNLVSSDHQTVGSTKYASNKVKSAITTGAYNDFTLNATGESNVSKTGVTKIATRPIPDVDNTEPSPDGGTEEQNPNCLYAENTGTGSDPKLVVNHSEPLVPGGTMSMMGI